MKAKTGKPLLDLDLNDTGAFTSGEVAVVPVGVWITATIKANADQSGLWGRCSDPAPRHGRLGQCVQPGRLELKARAVLLRTIRKRPDFLKTVSGRQCRFHTGHP
ncbi:MAG: hypothetical protein MO852_03755 [Candidatus Devosia euplotis]|nr:hypothetical protein [Candidatus Devosia euplotis]